MLAPADAERVTGYRVGGISPFGQKKRVAVFIENAALDHPTIIVNGGRRGLQIEIGGHTDSQGSAAFNQKLSEERAQAVREWAQANCPGLTPGNYTFKGYGETKPVAKNSTAAGRAQNRRVEFKVMNPEELKRLKERRETLMKESQGK